MDTAPDVKTYGYRAGTEKVIGFDGFKVNPHIVFFDPYGRPHHALITAVWAVDDNGKPMTVNLLWVTDDLSKTDSYGLQIERATSVVHKDRQGAHGNYFLTADEFAAQKAESVNA